MKIFVATSQLNCFSKERVNLGPIVHTITRSINMAQNRATPALRRYQQKIVDSILGDEQQSVLGSNAIVKMPTGSGKTVVAATLVNKIPGNSLFFVPTVDLVEQQANVLKTWCEDTLEVHEFHGGITDPPAVPKRKSSLVSTPQAFLSLQRRRSGQFGWEKFRLVVFDEVHHVLKDHPYRVIALSLKHWRESQQEHHTQQLIGMSASLTYSVDDRGIQNSLNRLCYELNVDKMISPSVSELVDGGYVPPHGENVEVENTRESIPDDVVPMEDRKPHLMHQMFMNRIQKGTATELSKLLAP